MTMTASRLRDSMRIARSKTKDFSGQFFSTSPFVRPDWLYPIKNDGTVLWCKHQDAAAGMPSTSIGPTPVAWGWQNFLDVIGASGDRFYVRTTNGNIFRYEHVGFNNWTPQWNGPIKVNSGWQKYKRI